MLFGLNPVRGEMFTTIASIPSVRVVRRSGTQGNLDNLEATFRSSARRRVLCKVQVYKHLTPNGVSFRLLPRPHHLVRLLFSRWALFA